MVPVDENRAYERVALDKKIYELNKKFPQKNIQQRFQNYLLGEQRSHPEITIPGIQVYMETGCVIDEDILQHWRKEGFVYITASILEERSQYCTVLTPEIYKSYLNYSRQINLLSDYVLCFSKNTTWNDIYGDCMAYAVNTEWYRVGMSLTKLAPGREEEIMPLIKGLSLPEAMTVFDKCMSTIMNEAGVDMNLNLIFPGYLTQKIKKLNESDYQKILSSAHSKHIAKTAVETSPFLQTIAHRAPESFTKALETSRNSK